jgi:hypothetical protein
VFKVQGRGELRASRPEETLPEQVMFFGEVELGLQDAVE